MSELPQGWVETTIGQVLELTYGKSLPAKKRSGEGYPVYGSNGEVGLHSEYLVEGPGIVVGRKGSHGKVNWVNKNFFPIDTTYFVEINNNLVTLEFVYHLLKRFDLKSLNRSTAIPGLNRNDAYEIKFPLPPLAEQKRIVAKLDVLFGELEALKGRLSNIPQLLQNFRQAVLSKGVTGKLTAEWRLSAKEEVGKDLGEWVETTIDEAKRDTLIGIVKSAKDQFYDEIEGSYCYLKMNNLKNDSSGLDLGNVVRVSLETKEKDKYSIEKGDLFFNTRNSHELVGKIGIANEEMRDFVFNNNLMRIRFKENFVPEFMGYFIASPIGQSQLEKIKSGTTNVAAIYYKNFKDFIIQYPPKEEQEEIVRRVEGLFEQASAIETKYQALTEYITKLPQAILVKAFRGELVEQLPTDGNVKTLLKEIKKLEEGLDLEKKNI